MNDMEVYFKCVRTQNKIHIEFLSFWKPTHILGKKVISGLFFKHCAIFNQEWMGTSQQESGHKEVPCRAQEYFWVWARKVVYFGAWKTSKYIENVLSVILYLLFFTFYFFWILSHHCDTAFLHVWSTCDLLNILFVIFRRWDAPSILWFHTIIFEKHLFLYILL